MTEGQRLAIEQLREIEAVSGDALEVLSVRESDAKAEVSILTRDFQRVSGGLPLRERERFIILVPQDFPFEHPSVATPHTRFAGFPHVQWSRHLCLYQAPNTEWDASDGMFGFLQRLDEWLRQGALDQLDPLGAPLHPPVAYAVSGTMIIPEADTPVVAGAPWYGLAHLKIISDRRANIVGWSPLFDENPVTPVGAAVLLAEAMPFEYPSTATDLIRELDVRGVSRELLLLVLQATVLRNPEDSPLYVLIGTPMRGTRGSATLKQHLSAWYISPAITKGLRLSLHKYSTHERLRELGAEVEKIIWDWAAGAAVSWCTVREARPEIVTRRDHDSPLSWFRGRTVALWGCGALGSHIAEFLARAGVAKLVLRDSGRVAPGVLVRQLYDDNDLGDAKVEALEHRLRRIRDDLEIEPHTGNLLDDPLGKDTWTDAVDLTIDTTGSRALLKKIELRWHGSPERRAVASMVVGPRAERGLVVLAQPNHSGGPCDVARRAKLTACADNRLHRFSNEFWPDMGVEGSKVFQPEPGCSDPTFVGSAADVAVLAGAMLNYLPKDLADDSASATAHFVTQPHLESDDPELTSASFAWTKERVVRDSCAGYEVRVAEDAWLAMLRCMDRSRRRRGPDVETGGLLFGECDDAARVVWVTAASDPPPDSRASQYGFVCGTRGTARMNEEKKKQSRGSVHFIGTWHTHPDAPPLPSQVDLSGMAQIVMSYDPPIRKALLVIVGQTLANPLMSAYLFRRQDFLLIQERVAYVYRSHNWLAWLRRLFGSFLI